MTSERVDPDGELLWEEFHRVVNMTSEELRVWLLTDASDEEAFRPGPSLGAAELGRKVLHVLGKRKVDLTDDDLATMRATIEFVEDHAEGPDEDDRRRHALMSVGHDPLRP
ncbi:DUF3140 domain-containing protein [Nonomuraea dietziae]|uniref:DUF3140 domain-containing protein n=1 Tax=Nonomuraea dietziae TaxID=65515 RepID=UPI0033C5215C